MSVYYTYMSSPIGELLLAGDGENLQLIGLPEGRARARAQADGIWLPTETQYGEAKRQLAAYFAGELQQFALALDPAGTPFQQQVWHSLRTIPYGATCSYGDIARQIGKPRAVRAVGAANGRNPLPIIIPCHRVIGSTGKLTGFSGGLAAKEALLKLEQRYATFQLLAG
jgi:methylated-DNA-[protein]-cysteine S-methyltransferase